MANEIKGVIYDLDGTIVDSAADIAGAVNATLGKWNLPTLPVPEVAKLVGSGGRNVCRLALKEIGADYDDEQIEAVFQDFFAYYKQNPVVHSKPYPGTIEGLEALQSAGFKQGVCTNKTSVVAGLVLEELDMARFFGSVIGGDATPSHKPDPAHLQHVIDELGLEQQQVAYVGDTVVDLETAKSAGVRYFAVAWANPSAHEQGFSETLNSVADLPAILSS